MIWIFRTQIMATKIKQVKFFVLSCLLPVVDMVSDILVTISYSNQEKYEAAFGFSGPIHIFHLCFFNLNRKALICLLELLS